MSILDPYDGVLMLASRRERPVLVYDGDCAFCTSCARVLRRIGPDADIVAWQLTDLAELGITEEQAADAVQWVQIDGTVRSGHEAIAAMLTSAGRIWKVIGRIVLLPGVSWLAEEVYRLVADNRYRLPGGTPACGRPSSADSRVGRRVARAHRVDVTEAIDTLANHDYASAFAVTSTGADVRSPEQWARATFEDAPAPLRSLVAIGWKYVLGLRLGPRRSPAHVLGWKIVDRTSDSIVLELRSSLVIAQKVVRVEGPRVVMTTFVRYRRRMAGAVWLAVAPIHHRTEPYLLAHAASSHAATG